MGDDIIQRFIELGLNGGDGDPTLSSKSQGTNKANLLAQQEHVIKVQSEVALTKIATPTHGGGSNKEIKLVEKNRVNIITVLDHVNHVMDDKFFLCRTISPTAKMAGIILIVVEDPEGEKALRLVLYNYPELTGTNLNLLFPVGSILAVKAPFLKVGMGGGLLRCDNPANLVIISESNFTTMFPNLGWKGSIEAKYVPTEDKVVQARNSGNRGFVEKNYLSAIRFYTNGLDLCKDVDMKIDLLSNRAAAYINLDCYRAALNDATAVLQRDPGHVKGIYRNVRALWGLGQYEEGLAFLKRKLKKIPTLKKETVLSDLQDLGEQFVIQNQTGIYDMATILKISEKDHKNPDLAEFMGALEIVEIPGKGRGLVAKKNFKAGELLICCKAFAHCNPGPKGDSLSVADRHLEMAGTIAQKILIDAELGVEFFKLFAGPDFDTTQNNDNMIDRIVAMNTFSPQDNDTTIKSSGVWIIPSYINHSCIDANAMWRVYGDFMFVRAVVPIRNGEEVTIPYTNPEKEFSKRKADLEGFKFTCACLLCEIQEGEEEETRERRRLIMLAIKRDVLGDLCPRKVRKVLENISKLEALHKVCPRLHLFFNDEIFTYFCSKLTDLKMYREFVIVMEKIHFVTEDTAMCMSAATASLNILGVHLFSEAVNVSLIKKWINIVKHDLMVTFGCLEPMLVQAPNILKRLTSKGFTFF